MRCGGGEEVRRRCTHLSRMATISGWASRSCRNRGLPSSQARSTWGQRSGGRHEASGVRGQGSGPHLLLKHLYLNLRG